MEELKNLMEAFEVMWHFQIHKLAGDPSKTKITNIVTTGPNPFKNRNWNELLKSKYIHSATVDLDKYNRFKDQYLPKGK